MKGVYLVLIAGLGVIALLVYNSGARANCSFVDTLLGKCGSS